MIGRKTTTVVSAVAATAASDLLGADVGRLGQALPEAPVAEDVFRDDVGAVVEHAHPQGQPAQRHNVERDVAEVKEIESGDDRDRQDELDDERRLPFLEEDEHDEKDQDDALDDLVVHGPDDRFDVAACSETMKMLTPGFSALIWAITSLASSRDLDGVGRSLLADQDADALPPVEPGHPLPLLDGVLDLGRRP